MTKAEKAAKKWKQCDVSKLVRHFHQFGAQSQYERLEAVHLTEESLDELFPIGEKIKSLDIQLGTSEKRSPIKRFTFQPYATVTFENKKNPDPKPFTHGIGGKPIDAQIVPYEFKEQLCKNWRELDINLMDDVFKANSKEKVQESDGAPSVRSTPKRLLGYHFTKEINPVLLKVLNERKTQIVDFIFHLGVDMNKFSAKDQFSFSPIFELRFANQPILEEKQAFAYSLHKLGVRSFETKGGDLVYLEYVLPCPSTCKSK